MRILNLIIAGITIILFAVAAFSSQVFNDSIMPITISLLLFVVIKLILSEVQFSPLKRLFVVFASILFASLASFVFALFPSAASYRAAELLLFVDGNPTFNLLFFWVVVSVTNFIFWTVIRWFWRELPWPILIGSSVIAGILAFPVSIILFLAIGSFVSLPELI